ncbi:sugar transferase [Clostridium celatum]|uniref:Bacterial sugar transferase n=1 Tax=Clostridium celatum DSM 1785 TaxID=545697 RepID=L1QNB1_9CLOT|nr:sugar transferase [Clostridium celatum]EKY29057.1 bacterial sugar transferase [Clostridium celatum DSM 1785]MCE9654385.1 sugar transferase [Clostridium celatum]MDU2265593.1 sugar transferase [Clostridium celatum]MDU3722229.1 sugar transferase [Clostridium celatum]MDU6295449.1 sugar transferase [Clostridium celatum]
MSLKRCFDLILSLLGIVILSPIFIIIYILILVTMRESPIFTQVRTGYKEKLFKIYKFKTMVDKYDEEGKQLPDSERLTKVGRVLRLLSLDEIPQLFNVLKGDMSLVGPRPLLERYLPYYKAEERKRFNVKPGITGLSQINGRNSISWEERFSYDIYYVDNYSFLLDMKIILKTFIKVFKFSDIKVATNLTLNDLDVERRVTNYEYN